MSRVMRSITLIVVSFSIVLLPTVASAHERRDVGKYQFVVGFLSEPAFQEEPNGIDLRVTNKETGEPVEGLADTLQAQVISGSQQRDMKLRPVFNQPGHYKSEFFPTAAGDYTFRFFGEIEGIRIDETFTSGPGRFNPVQAPAELHFPVKVPIVTDLNTQLAAVHSNTRIAMAIGGAGLALGIISLLGTIVAVRSRRNAAVMQGAGATTAHT